MSHEVILVTMPRQLDYCELDNKNVPPWEFLTAVARLSEGDYHDEIMVI